MPIYVRQAVSTGTVTMSRVSRFIPRAHTQNPVSPNVNTVKKKSSDRIRGKNEREWTRNIETRTRKKFLAVGEACKAIISGSTQGLKGRPFVKPGFSTGRRPTFLRPQYPTAGVGYQAVPSVQRNRLTTNICMYT